MFFRYLSLKKLSGFTVHDRFFMPPAQGIEKLYNILKTLYLHFYTEDLFKKNFKDTYLYAARIQENSNDYLEKSHLFHPNFIKM